MSFPLEEEPKSLLEKISSVPCMRTSYLYGIGTGIATGLVHFMFTSKVRLSTHVGFAGFVVSTMGYWMYCRAQWSKSEEEARLFKQLVTGELAVESLQKEGPPTSVSNVNPDIPATNL